ncbi:IclR family transcriptional regulator [Lutibaculum baratangense]|uniref:Transcriptional regulator, IclR family n=1 Tax=Lutibaculum baratangense AMV1 TaxID=631454 RepID=V4RPI1_9HYPH|nr:IclR family transcriptional regulator [Lutibaculum baratangense]ESR27189.1 transcriptional regulator, IclR family [Lutibaculum baratangense AMV1]
MRERRTVQSVERALDILEALSASDGELQLREIAQRTGINLSTCHHLLMTLMARGYAGQHLRDRSYFLGNKVFEISSMRSRQIDLVPMAMPDLRHLNRETQETVHLEVLRGTDLTTLAKLESRQAVRVGTDSFGKSNAAHATATGKAILAWLPENEMMRVIAEKGLSRFTDRTITTLAGLVEALRVVRRSGYSTDEEEFTLGVTCVGAALRDHSGAVVGAVSCSMPAMRADRAHLDAVTKAVRRCAASISNRLGDTTARNGGGGAASAA